MAVIKIADNHTVIVGIVLQKVVDAAKYLYYFNVGLEDLLNWSLLQSIKVLKKPCKEY